MSKSAKPPKTSVKPSNKVLLVLALIMVVNALSYGTIIPLLYPYAAKFSINPLGLSFLFTSFSIAQFIATPIIGRLSDKYGRKPLLIISILGTSISLAVFAMARSTWMLFVSRIFDGITAGNNSVAQAVIADKTDGPERAKAFGLLGAAFGFGFLFGPAIGGLLTVYGITAPFWFASGLSFVAAILAAVFLEETVVKGTVTKAAHREKLINPKKLVAALFTPVVGAVLLLTLITSVAQNMFIIGFQTHTVDVLKLSPRDIGLLFATAGLVSILVQGGGLRILLEKVPSKRRLLGSLLILSSMVLLPMGLLTYFWWFVLALILYMFFFAPMMPVLSAILSERTRAEDQGGILGLNQAYLSVGQIVGPLLAGAVASFSVPAVFAMAAVTMGSGAIIMKLVEIPPAKKADI